MFFLILSGIALALIAPAIYTISRKTAVFIFSLYPLVFLIYLLKKLPEVLKDIPIVEFYHWVPILNINISIYADGLSMLFAIMITSIGFLVMIYSAEYMKTDKEAGRFFLFILLFMASMLGLVLSGNIICLFIFWELTSISSFFLIGHKHKDKDSRKSAVQALLVTGGGGLLLLAGLIIIGIKAGTYEFSELLNNTEIISDFAYTPILLLIVAGAFTKSAQFPFHFWLPNAMTAPTPVSAYLHSATMVKAGVYLLLRMSPILGETVLWSNLLMYIGAFTMLIGAVMAVLQKDLKKILAYSTVSSLGTLVLLIGIGGEFAIKAAVVFLIIHSIYKAALFLVAGSIDQLTGTRDISKLGGLFKFMPLIALAGIFAALSYSGIPPLIGFIGKELIYEAALTVGEEGSYLFIGLAVVSNILLVITAINAGIKPFIGKSESSELPQKVPFLLWIGPAILAISGLLLGVFPKILANTFISQAVSAILNVKTQVHLALWHGINEVLFLSVLTVALGVGLYFLKIYRMQENTYVKIVLNRGPEKWYNLGINSMVNFACFQTRLLQNGYLRHYLLAIILSLLLILVITIFNHLAPPFVFHFKKLMIYELFLGATIIIATIAVVVTKSRLMAVASLGLAGYGISLIFVLFGAPDIAMTQFTIDTLTVILFVLILYKLPKFSTMSPSSARVRDMTIALVTGAIITFIILYVTALPFDPGLKRYFAQNSYILAKGRNVVNVILVDFRSLDTMVEITVLAVAAIGVYALLKLKLENE